MQADQHNYQPDKQFTDKGWNEMLKSLDKEMPVQEKKRRGFFWFLPFLLIGVAASVWAFYPNNQRTEIAQSQSQSQSQSQISEIPAESKIEIENQNIASENQITETKNNQNVNNKAKVDEDFPSIIESSGSLLPQVIEEILPVDKIEVIEEKDPLANLENEILPLDPSFITLALLELQEREELEMEEKEFYFEEEIIENSEPTKRKTEFGVYAGVVGDFANIKKPGLMTGAFVHFLIGKKIGLKTGIGYSQLQKEHPFYFTGNQEAALSNEFLSAALAVPPFSTVAVRSNSDFILEKFHQLDLPVLLTYSPIKRMEFQLGANATYLIKDQTRLIDNNLYINESVNNDYTIYGIELDALDLNSISQNQYADENYWTKLNVSAVVGLAWKPTRRINLAFQYHYGFLPILKSNNNNGAELIGSASIRTYEVYDNSGGFDPGTQVPNANLEGYRKSLFNNEKFIKYNNSIRFSIEYNF